MRPYPGIQLDDNKKRIYNYRLCRARRVVENAFLPKDFVFIKEGYNQNVDWIILATCVLHNYIRDSDKNMINVSNSVDRANADITLQDFSARGLEMLHNKLFLPDNTSRFFCPRSGNATQ